MITKFLLKWHEFWYSHHASIIKNDRIIFADEYERKLKHEKWLKQLKKKIKEENK